MPRHPFKGFTILESDAPLLAQMTDTQRYVLTSRDNQVQMMAHMRCASETVKTRRHRARKVLVKMREEIERAKNTDCSGGDDRPVDGVS